MNNYKHITPFKGWVLENFPFIEADFDAITNYQLISKVVEYLNQIVSNENSLKQTLDNLIAYINSLDIDAEIDERLDEMVEDGTLERLLHNALNLFEVYNTYTDLMSISSTLVEGLKIKTLGYYEIDDGGSAEYIVTDTVDSNKYQVSLGNDLYLELVSHEINVKQFGAYGDNSHNDYDAFEAAINYARVNGLKQVNVAEGTYLVNKPILLYDRIALVGENRHTTSIVKNGNTTDSIHNVDAIIELEKELTSEVNYTRGQTIKNLSLLSNSNSTYGIYAHTSAPYTTLENLIISNVVNGIYYLHGAWVSTFKDITIADIVNGLAYKDTGTSTNMKNIYVQRASGKGYDINGLGYSDLQNLCADWCTNTVYSFSYCNLTINGLGCESEDASLMLDILNSNVIINSAKIFTNNDDENASVFQIQGSRLTFNGGSIGGSSEADALGKMATINTNSYIEFNKMSINTNFLTRSVGSAAYNVIRINGEKSCYSVSPSGDAPYIGLGEMMPPEYQDNNIDHMNLGVTGMNSAGIFSNVYGNVNQGVNSQRNWARSKKSGDIFINQAPDKTGIALFQQISDPISFQFASAITGVTDTSATTKTLTFSTLNLDELGSIKQIQIRVGDSITCSSGATAKIDSIDYGNNSLVISSINGEFSVGNTISLNGKYNVRDAIYRPVQQMLEGYTSDRVRNPRRGLMYFDRTLGKPIWYTGSKWVDATGTEV